MCGRFWTSSEDESLRQLWPSGDKARMAEELDRPWNAINKHAFILGLRKKNWDQYYAKVVQMAEQRIEISPLDAAYLAGLFDGEGSIGISVLHTKKKRFLATPAISISNSHRDVLEWAMEVTGKHGVIFQAYRVPEMRNWMPVFSWKITGYRTVPILRLIHPFLKIKKKQASLLLDFYASRKTHPGRPYTTEEWEIAAKIRESNRRGKKAHYQHYEKTQAEVITA